VNTSRYDAPANSPSAVSVENAYPPSVPRRRRARSARPTLLTTAWVGRPQPGHQKASTTERTSPATFPVAIHAARGIGDVRWTAELRAIHFHHLQEHLLAGFQASPKNAVRYRRECRATERRALPRLRVLCESSSSAASFLGCVDPRSTKNGWKKPRLFFSADQFNSPWDIPRLYCRLPQLISCNQVRQ